MNQKEFKEKAIEFVHQILEEMYEQAEPGMNYRQALNKGERPRTPYYKLNYLPQKQQRVIMARRIKQLNLPNQRAEQIIKTNVNMGASPYTVKKGVNKFREQEGLPPIHEGEYNDAVTSINWEEQEE